MLYKKDKDYIYILKECQLNPEKETTVYKDKSVEVTVFADLDKKEPFYYRIKNYIKDSKVTMLPKTLIIESPNKKFPNKMVGNFISQDLTLCEYTFNKIGYVIFGKVCTEENI